MRTHLAVRRPDPGRRAPRSASIPVTSASGRTGIRRSLQPGAQSAPSAAVAWLQRSCDPAALAGRTALEFFPAHPLLQRVFDGRATLSRSSSGSMGIGLVQQALVDLCYDLGTRGGNRNGVDNDFGGSTETAVEKFQQDQGLPETGKVDSTTLRCLDQERLKRAIPCNVANITPADIEIGGESDSGSGNVQFARGSAAITSDDRKHLAEVGKRFHCQPLTLQGFESEDELVEFGPGLAQQRIDAVKAELEKARGFVNVFETFFGDPSKVCPATPAHVEQPQPLAKRGELNFRGLRKVEILEERQRHTSSAGGTRVADACNATETARIQGSHPLALTRMKKAIDEIAADNSDAISAVALFFGSSSRKRRVLRNLRRWRRWLDRRFASRFKCSDEADNDCDDTDAYHKSGKIVFCRGFLDRSATEPKDADLIIHEAGHAAIGTDDVSYDFQRLQRFLPLKPNLALKNTDSYLMLIDCINKLPAACSLPAATDDTSAITDAGHAQAAGAAIAWLEKWADYAWQGFSYLATEATKARTSPRGWYNSYEAPEVDRFMKAFGLKRPRHAIPTTRDVLFIAGVLERFSAIDDLVSGEEFEASEDAAQSDPIVWTVRQNDDLMSLSPAFFSQSPREQVIGLYEQAALKEGIGSQLAPIYTRVAERMVTEVMELNQP